jgi:TRAP-type C4-dicarboxylate transport system permease small subunit
MQHPPNPVGRYAEPVARYLSILVGWGILAFSVALSLEIIGRKMWGTSFKGMDELGGFILAIAAATGASYSMALRAHTRVDVFLVRFSPGVQRVLNTLALIALAGFAVFAAWRGYAVLAETLEFRSSAVNLNLPLAYPQIMWVLGLAMFAGIALAYALHATYLLLSGKPGLNAYYGPLSVDEELESELQALESRAVPGSKP